MGQLTSTAKSNHARVDLFFLFYFFTICLLEDIFSGRFLKLIMEKSVLVNSWFPMD